MTKSSEAKTPPRKSAPKRAGAKRVPAPARSPTPTYSISTLAHELGRTRTVVSEQLAHHGCKPFELVGGYPRYRLRDVLALIRPADDQPKPADPGAPVDPSKMAPAEREAHYRAELRRQEFERNSGQLIPAADFEATASEQQGVLVQAIDALPDQIEHMLGLDAEQVEKVVRHCNGIRRSLHAVMRRRFAAAGQPENNADTEAAP